jgi:heat shock protein HspQ
MYLNESIRRRLDPFSGIPFQVDGRYDLGDNSNSMRCPFAEEEIALP